MFRLKPSRAAVVAGAGILVLSSIGAAGFKIQQPAVRRMQQTSPKAAQGPVVIADSLSRIVPGIRTHKAKRNTTGCICTSGHCYVDVTVEVRNATNDAGVNKPAPADRQIAVIRNNGNCTEKKYGLLPFNQAEYLLFLKGGAPNTPARWELTEVLANGRSRSKWTGVIQLCAAYSPPETSDVNFYTCTFTDKSPNKRPHPAASNVNRLSIFSPFDGLLRLFRKDDDHLAQELDSPIWIACANGCCTLG
jgi:hypothetical protein